MKIQRTQIGTSLIVAGSELRLFLASRVYHGGRRVPACQRGDVVEFDAGLSMLDLARLGAALSCREWREDWKGDKSDGPLVPAPAVDVGGVPFIVKLADRDESDVGSFRACLDSRELMVRRHTKARAVVWGIGAADTAWMWWVRSGDGRGQSFAALQRPPAPVPRVLNPWPKVADLLRRTKAHHLAELVEDFRGAAAELGYDPCLMLALALYQAAEWEPEDADHVTGAFYSHFSARPAGSPCEMIAGPQPAPESLPDSENDSLRPDFEAVARKLFGDDWRAAA